MATFGDNVFDVFSQLCEKHGFVPAKAMAGKHFASLVKKLSDEAYAYVFVHDGRSGDGELVVSVWISPLHAPDDGLDKLNVGYKILIASAFDVDDEFFHRCEERIVNLLPALGALSEVVETELSHHTLRSQRWEAYQHERQAFASLNAIANNEADSACAKALSTARRVAKGGASYNGLEKACVAAAKTLLDHDAISDDASRFYDGDAEFLGSSLTSLVYVDALGDS